MKHAKTGETLSMLFDYQRFEKDTRLEKLIARTEDRYRAELPDDALQNINAAGEPWCIDKHKNSGDKTV